MHSVRFLIIGTLFCAADGLAQSVQHTPLKGITVWLRAFTKEGKANDTSCSRSEPYVLQATTDDGGEFMFGYVPTGTYSLGCSYNSCYLAFRKIKRSVTDTSLSEEPSMHISVNACEGMVCHLASKKITPDDWSNSQSSASTTITRDWGESTEWLKAGGGVTLRIDRANAVISGTIEAH